jgi:hypothetical protein
LVDSETVGGDAAKRVVQCERHHGKVDWQARCCCDMGRHVWLTGGALHA